jgi:hypothetical protein
MTNLIRKYQQPMLIGITIVLIASFIWYWNGPAGHGGIGGEPRRASIYGQSITDSDLKRDINKFRIAADLGLNTFVEGLAGNAQNRQQAVENFIWNSYIFQHEADALQVFPTDTEVQDELARVPGFQTDGRFDPVKLTEYVQNVLPSLGFSDSIIDELVRDQVRVKKVTALIGATVDITPAELKNRYAEENEKMDLSVIRLSTSDLAKGIAVTDADARKNYDQHQDLYHSDEQRKVSVARFELTDAQKKLTGPERTAALQKLGNDAWNFAQAVVDKNVDFAAQAKKAGVPLADTGLFTEAQPDPAYENIPAITTNAFRLTADLPSSDVVEGSNGYYVLHLVQVAPSRQLAFDEAKPKVIAAIQKERAAQMMQTRANEIRNQILADLKAGKTFSQAATDAGTTAESIPPFSLAEASKLDEPDLQPVIENAVSLGDHQLSDFVESQDGGLFVYVNGRQPVDPATAGLGEAESKDEYATQMQTAAFVEWLRLRKDNARLQIVQQ